MRSTVTEDSSENEHEAPASATRLFFLFLAAGFVTVAISKSVLAFIATAAVLSAAFRMLMR